MVPILCPATFVFCSCGCWLKWRHLLMRICPLRPLSLLFGEEHDLLELVRWGQTETKCGKYYRKKRMSETLCLALKPAKQTPVRTEPETLPRRVVTWQAYALTHSAPDFWSDSSDRRITGDVLTLVLLDGHYHILLWYGSPLRIAFLDFFNL